MNFTRIVAVRHGETAWNQDARIQGHLDIGLNPTGQRQARLVAQALRQEPVAAVYASDLSRALDTARAIATEQGLPVQPHAGLRERCFGEFEGKTWTELEAGWPDAALAWRQRVPTFAPAGGENLLQLRARVVAALSHAAAQHMGEQIVVVAHGGVLDMLYRVATGVDMQAPRTWHLGNAAINRLLWTPESLTLVGWGDTSHLDRDVLDEEAA